MKSDLKISYPGSKKTYVSGVIHPSVKVGMRVVTQMPTVTIKDGEKTETPNQPIYIYDTSGPYGDDNIDINLENGLPLLRESWIKDRWSKDSDNICQMYYAKKGIITPEMEYVAIRENMNCQSLGIKSHITPEFVRKEVAEGRAVIPACINHPESEPMIIGRNFLTKINANIGNSATTSSITVRGARIAGFLYSRTAPTICLSIRISFLKQSETYNSILYHRFLILQRLLLCFCMNFL